MSHGSSSRDSGAPEGGASVRSHQSVLASDAYECRLRLRAIQASLASSLFTTCNVRAASMGHQESREAEEDGKDNQVCHLWRRCAHMFESYRLHSRCWLACSACLRHHNRQTNKKRQQAKYGATPTINCARHTLAIAATLWPTSPAPGIERQKRLRHGPQPTSPPPAGATQPKCRPDARPQFRPRGPRLSHPPMWAKDDDTRSLRERSKSAAIDWCATPTLSEAKPTS